MSEAQLSAHITEHIMPRVNWFRFNPEVLAVVTGGWLGLKPHIEMSEFQIKMRFFATTAEAVEASSASMVRRPSTKNMRLKPGPNCSACVRTHIGVISTTWGIRVSRRDKDHLPSHISCASVSREAILRNHKASTGALCVVSGHSVTSCKARIPTNAALNPFVGL